MNLTSDAHRRQIGYWLLLCAVVIFIMIVLGGVTRLTRSGLSIVEWQPLTGILPPLSEQAWQAEFEKYQAYPEYRHVNRRMSLSEFKSIYYFEYAHRLLGRLIGLLFFIPFLYFYFRRRIPQSLTPQLLGIFILGGLQGLLGWYMVKSGLVHEPRVSHYRLCAHLGMAVLIYAYIFWLACKLLTHNQNMPQNVTAYRSAQLLVALIFIMILSGGLVAGTRAGLIYNSFPLMDGQWIPEGLLVLRPLWRNMFENLITIQFNHRLLAYMILLFGLILSLDLLYRSYSRHIRIAVYALLAALLLQISLGISTLLLQVPVALGAAHQGGAILLLSSALFLCYRLKPESS